MSQAPSEAKDRHGDAAIALAMADSASDADGIEIDFTVAPNGSKFRGGRSDIDDEFEDTGMLTGFGSSGAW